MYCTGGGKNISILNIVETQKKLTELRLEHWKHEEVFSFQWWLQIALLIIPWIIWWKLVDKKRIGVIFSYGLLVLIFTSLMDNVGVELTLWGYPCLIVPVIVRLFGVNFSILPVSYMLIYQYFTKWTSFLIANTLFALFASFVGEPIYVLLDMYELYKWKYIYSVPIYIALAVFLKFLVEAVFDRKK